MRPGDLVEFKAGMFGIAPPANIGIFLERQKRKKQYRLIVVTLQGVKEVAPNQVTKRRFRAQVDPGAPETELVDRLKALIRDQGAGALDADGPTAEVGLDERTAWERLTNEVTEPATVQELADRLAGASASKGDVRRLDELLQRCRRPGVGFFEAAGRGLWRPISVDAFKGFQQMMEACDRFRKRLVRVVTVEDDSGEAWETFEGVLPHTLTLDEHETVLWAALVGAMRAYVEVDRWPDDALPPGCSVHTLQGRSFHRFVDHLARDWTGATGVSRSSVMVQFLVDTGACTVQDAIRLIARRRVLAAPGFAWATPDVIEERAARLEEPAVQAAADPLLYEVRRDLRGLETYTIDPPDAKDFDDAVSLERHDDGTSTLWVHIADVSHYVERDSTLDRHARERATSVYLPTGVLPMLPSHISDDLCSLRAGVDRFAMSVRLDVDGEGKVTGAEPFETLIRVDENLSYGDVDGALPNGVEPFAGLADLAKRMRSHRQGLDIETGELRIRFAESAAADAARAGGLVERGEEDIHAGGPQTQGAKDDDRDGGEGGTSTATPARVSTATGLDVTVKYATPATRMIETFMVATNEAVSRFVAERKVPVPYRCHPLPERTKAERFAAQAQVLGLDVRIELPDDEGGVDTARGETEGPADDAGPSILEQLQGGKLQLGGFAASETVGSAGEAEDGPDATRSTSATTTDGGPALRGLAQLDAATRERWLKPFRDALLVVEAIDDEERRDLAYLKVLSTLGRALYTSKNLGHFGLGSTSYAHFTSPIRRYPDLMLHRQLRWLLRGGDPTTDEPPHLGRFLDDFCAQSTAQAEEAERLERGLLDCCMVFESRKPAFAGPLSAIVNGITSGGLFLTLPGGLEARLAMRDIPGGPYEVDEHGTMMFRAVLPGGAAAPEDPDAREVIGHDWRAMEDPDTGALRDVRLALGDRVRVQVRERDFVDGRVLVRLASRV